MLPEYAYCSAPISFNSFPRSFSLRTTVVDRRPGRRATLLVMAAKSMKLMFSVAIGTSAAGAQRRSGSIVQPHAQGFPEWLCMWASKTK